MTTQGGHTAHTTEKGTGPEKPKGVESHCSENRQGASPNPPTSHRGLTFCHALTCRAGWGTWSPQNVGTVPVMGGLLATRGTRVLLTSVQSSRESLPLCPEWPHLKMLSLHLIEKKKVLLIPMANFCSLSSIKVQKFKLTNHCITSHQEIEEQRETSHGELDENSF